MRLKLIDWWDAVRSGFGFVPMVMAAFSIVAALVTITIDAKRDISAQIVLGTFVATYIYCLLVMHTVRDENGQVFVPHLPVSCGVALRVLSPGASSALLRPARGGVSPDEPLPLLRAVEGE